MVIGIVAAIASGGKSSSSSPSPVVAPSPSRSTTAADPAASPTQTANSSSSGGDTVTYIVTGTSGADVTYGPAGSDSSGNVPMNVTKPLQNAAYYALNAQLQGGGQVECEIEVDGKVISQATASGGYNIASCEITQDPMSGNWTDTNSG
jgi:hypothetical protein